MSDCDRVVHPTHGDDAHGTSRPVDEFDSLGEHLLDAVAVDGVCVTAADLHELELSSLGEHGDVLQQHARRRRIPVLVHESHRASSADPG